MADHTVAPARILWARPMREPNPERSELRAESGPHWSSNYKVRGGRGSCHLSDSAIFSAMPTETSLPGSGTIGFQQLPDAEERQRQLVRMKRRATGLLVLMACVFVVAYHFEPGHP